MDTDLPFQSKKIENQFKQVVDLRIESYDDSLEEVYSLADESLLENYMGGEMGNFLRNFLAEENILDTDDTKLYKRAVSNGVPVKLLDANLNINPYRFRSEEEVNKSRIRYAPRLSYEEFLEGIIANSSDRAIDHFSKIIPSFDPSLYSKRSWEEKVERWREEDSNTLVNVIYSRHYSILLSSIQPDIKSAYLDGDIKVVSRNIKYAVTGFTEHIYDKFIFFSPDNTVPFIKSYISGTPISYKIYTKITDSRVVRKWLNVDDKIEKKSPLQSNFLFFLINPNPDSSNYLRCYLSEDSLIINSRSEYSNETLFSLLSNIMERSFGVEISNPEEVSVDLEANLNSFPEITVSYLQFYLLSDTNFIMNLEAVSNISSMEKRKIEIEYYPVMDLDRLTQYTVKYSTNNLYKLRTTGPSEEKCLNFFVNIFGRLIQSFFLRQPAIGKLFDRLLAKVKLEEETASDKSRKKKKDLVVHNKHLFTHSSKIKVLEDIITIPPTKYSRNICPCHKQPIIITEEESKALIESGNSIFDKKGETDPRKSMDMFTLQDGRKIGFMCPTLEEAYLTVVDVGEGSRKIQVPCCGKQYKPGSYDTSKIRIQTRKWESESGAGDDGEAEDDTKKSLPKSSKDNPYIPHELEVILTHWMGSNGFRLTKAGKKNIFPYSVIQAVGKSTSRISEYRAAIQVSVDSNVMAQEAIGIDLNPRVLLNEIGNSNEDLDSKIHFRAFEEYFKIHIFVFELYQNKISDYLGSDNNFNLEIPYHKMYSARVLYNDRPCIVLFRWKGESSYAILTDSSGSTLHSSKLSSHLMDIFYHVHETSTASRSEIRRNPFSRINWEYFFQKDPIVGQEIDIVGKARVFKLESGMIVNVPPTQPLSVPLIENYTYAPPEYVIETFGNPKTWDSRGLWYDLMGMNNRFYVLTGSHNLGPSPETSDPPPLNIFIPKEEDREDLRILEFSLTKRMTFALIQIIQWGWAVDGRPDFISWLTPMVENVTDYPDLIEEIHVSLPNVRSAIEGFSVISSWWPEMFTPEGRIKLYPELKDSIFAFFDKESKQMVGNKFGKKPQIITGLYDSPDSFPSRDFSRVFIGTEEFNSWATTDRIREDNVSVTVASINSLEDIRSKLKDKTCPVRIPFRDSWIIVKNVPSGTYEEALMTSHRWGMSVSQEFVRRDYIIITLAFTKAFEVVEFNESNHAESAVNRLYIFMYPDDTYAAVIS